MTMTRRELLAQLALSSASAIALPGLARAAGTTAIKGRPRTLIQIVMQGGSDAILTTNPKTKTEVKRGVDVPYEESEITRVNGVSIGPLMKALVPFVPRMAILNGVIGSTVSHEVGKKNLVQMRRSYPETAPGLAGTLGAMRLGDAPLTDVRMNYTEQPPTGRSLVLKGVSEDGMLARLSRIAASPTKRAAAEQALARELASCGSPRACMPSEAIKSLLDHLAREPLPTAADFRSQLAGPEGDLLQRWSPLWRDAMFIARHRLAPAVVILTPQGWDSHAGNLGNQTTSWNVFGRALAILLERIAVEKAADGAPLVDEVALVISSELGRFPYKNQYDGKDHFPEFPVMFVGPGIRPGQYGRTDAAMTSLPISRATGATPGPKDAFIPTIDDLGVTLLQWFGIEDAASLGYVGRHLDFLFA